MNFLRETLVATFSLTIVVFSHTSAHDDELSEPMLEFELPPSCQTADYTPLPGCETEIGIPKPCEGRAHLEDGTSIH